MLTLTRHFIERWRERVGDEPDPEEIEKIIKSKHTVKVQGCRLLFDPKGRPFKQPAIYWHPEKNVVIKIDEVDQVAITVLSPVNGREKDAV